MKWKILIGAGLIVAGLTGGLSARAEGFYSMKDAEWVAGKGNEATTSWVMCLHQAARIATQMGASDDNYKILYAIQNCAKLEVRVLQEGIWPTVIVGKIYTCGFSPKKDAPEYCK